MPSWSAVAFGVAVSAALAAVAVWLLLRERRISVLLLGFGPPHAASGRRLALTATTCGLLHFSLTSTSTEGGAGKRSTAL